MNTKTIFACLEAFLYVIVSFSVFLAVVQPEVWGTRFVSRYAVHLMFGTLIFGLLFVYFKKERLAFVHLAGCFLLALFLKSNFNDALFSTHNVDNDFTKIAYVNWDEVKDTGRLLANLNDADIDILSIFSSDTSAKLDAFPLSNKYPYQTIHHEANQAFWLFSRSRLHDMSMPSDKSFPVSEVQTTLLGNPTSVSLYLTNVDQNIVEDRPSAFSRLLNDMASTIRYDLKPAITLGTFNDVSWTSSMRSFLESSGLRESRQGYLPALPISQKVDYSLPRHHIFHSSDIACHTFVDIFEGSRIVGVIGSFHWRGTNKEVRPTS